MHAGQVIAERFLLERLAGAGGMGAIYRAHDRVTDGTVALKVLLDCGPSDSGRFAREAELLSELRHPAIVRYVAHGATAGGERYLAMEWLDGQDLAQRLAAGPLTSDEAETLALRVAEALAAAHAHGVVHRDIKPSNLFLPGGAIDRATLLDFGIARNTAAAASTTLAGVMLGTLGYIAPEQARGASAVDGRADVFALGSVLFECVAGRPAFAGDHPMALLAKILMEDPPRLDDAGGHVSPNFASLVQRMLAKDPQARPRDGAALVAELRSLAGAAPQQLPSVAQSITGGEQRVLCILMARGGGQPAADPSAPTLAEYETGGTIAELRAVAAAHYAHLEQLVDGSFVLTLAGNSGATDQAALAARCALAVRKVLAPNKMALATGRGEVIGRWPVGEVIDRAARLLVGERAPDGGCAIRIDDVTAGLLDVRFDVGGGRDGLDLRGEREIVESTRTLLGKPTPLVGRERELSLIEGIWNEAVSEPAARAVLVTGAPGLGKSRLRHEMVSRLRRRGDPCRILIGRGDPMSAGSPLGMLAGALRREFNLLDGEPLQARQRKLHARLSRHLAGADLQRVEEFLAEVVGTPFSDEDRVQLRAARRDAKVMGDQIRRAFEDWIAAECAQQPMLIVLEDLHWGDFPTVRLIDAALKSAAERPLMVLAMARPEALDLFPRLWEGRPLTRLGMGDLSKRACEKLVRAVLGDNTPTERVAAIVSRAAGNAFYLEELIRAVADGRGDALPATIVAMVQARLAELSVDARRVLRAASVFGQVFWKSGAQALLGAAIAAREADQWLAHLVDREVIVRRGEGKFPGEVEYAFRHASLQEASYQMLTDGDRAVGHRLAGAWLERAGESEAVTLAEHFGRGGEPRAAVRWWRRAAEQALEGDDLQAVIARAERGVDCGADGEARGELLLLSAVAHNWRGDYAEARRCASEAVTVFARGGASFYRAVSEAASAASILGLTDEVIRLVDELDAPRTGDDDGGAQIVAAARAALQLYFGGRYDLASQVAIRVETLAQAGPHRPFTQAWIHRAREVHVACTGDPGAHLLHSEAAARSFDEAGDLRSSCMQRVNLGFASIELGAYREAAEALRASVAAADRMGLSHIACAGRNNLGIALARLGSFAEARTVENEAIAGFVAQGDRRLEGGSRIYLSLILALDGDLPGAEREARDAIAALVAVPTLSAHALGVLGQVLLARGRGAEALAAAREAMAIVATLGALEEGEALVRLVFAQSLFAVGDEAAARAAIAEGRARVLKVAAKIADERLRKSYLTNVPENARTISLAGEWCGAPEEPPSRK